MEFQGRIAKILPARTGVSQRTGNEWKSLDVSGVCYRLFLVAKPNTAITDGAPCVW